MWISLQNGPVNFDLILRYYIEGKVLTLVTINKDYVPFFYASEEKVKRVKTFLDKTLNYINDEEN